MTGAYSTERFSGSREAAGPLHLAAPLRESWNVPFDFTWGSLAPVFGSNGLLVGCHKGKLLAIKADTREVVWKRPGSAPVLLHDGSVVTRSDEGLSIVDLETGALRRVLRIGHVSACVMAGDLLIASTWNPEYDVYAIAAYDWKNAQGLWSVPLGAFSRVSRISVRDQTFVYQSSPFGESNATTVARDVATGAALWSRTEFPLLPAEHVFPITSAGLVVSAGKLYSIDCATGRDQWSVDSVAGSPYVYQGRIYQHGWGGYAVTDLHSGKPLLRVNLTGRLPKSLQRTALLNVALVSETHLFIGAENGALFAFTRDKGEYVSNFHLPGGCKVATDLVCIDGRAYHRSGYQRLSCLESRA